MPNQFTHRLLVTETKGKLVGQCRCGKNFSKYDHPAELRIAHNEHKAEARRKENENGNG